MGGWLVVDLEHVGWGGSGFYRGPSSHPHSEEAWRTRGEFRPCTTGNARGPLVLKAAAGRSLSATTGNTLKEVKHTLDRRQARPHSERASNGCSLGDYLQQESLIRESSQTTHSSINRHNVMPLKFNPAALIPLKVQ